MNKRDILEVAIKIIGLYLVLLFVGSMSTVGGAISTADNQFIENKTVLVGLTCLAALLYFIFAVAFLCRGRRIAEMLTQDSEIGPASERPLLPPYARLSFWVRLLGLYFFVSVSSRLVSAIAQAGYTIRSGFWWSRIIGEAFELILAIIFVLKSERVSQFVERHAEPIAGGNAALPRASA
jgi:hypothetical protein